jgi:hypothetical protein
MLHKSCLPLSTYAQTSSPHHYELMPPALFGQCNPTSVPMEVVWADPSLGWSSLNFIASTMVLELTGECSMELV